MAFQNLDFCIVCMLLLAASSLMLIDNASGTKFNDRPIIGVLTQVSPSSLEKYGASYITASYIKYLETGGARVVPILVNQTDEYYETMFNSTNGVLFPGGGTVLVSTSGYEYSAHMMYTMAINANKAGDFYPVWGTCLGFETLMRLTAGNNILKPGIDSADVSIPVNLAPGYEESRLLSPVTIPKSVMNTLTTENSTYNHHNKGVTPTNFTNSALLKSFYRVLSTNLDANGVEFISMVEGNKYPVYGSQWHPEKNSFEFKVNACHTLDCVGLAQYMANFFVQEARKSNHHFSSAEEENKHLIYNYPAVFDQESSAFEQVYCFQ